MSVTCKVFSATMVADRAQLGAKATEWVRKEGVVVSKIETTQSSDCRFHCLTLSLFGDAKKGERGRFMIEGRAYDGVEIFSATKAREREELGERLVQWMGSRRLGWDDVHIETRQSSDDEFHCLTWFIFFAAPK